MTLHALRRFADRVMGLEPVLEGLTDREAVEALRGLSLYVDGIKRGLAFYGYPGPRWGAAGVTVGKVGLVWTSGARPVPAWVADVIVTVLKRHAYELQRQARATYAEAQRLELVLVPPLPEPDPDAEPEAEGPTMGM